MHPSEPSLEQLRIIQKQLFTEESTNENIKKLKAIEKQIYRHEKAKKEKEECATAT